MWRVLSQWWNLLTDRQQHQTVSVPHSVHRIPVRTGQMSILRNGQMFDVVLGGGLLQVGTLWNVQNELDLLHFWKCLLTFLLDGSATKWAGSDINLCTSQSLQVTVIAQWATWRKINIWILLPYLIVIKLQTVMLPYYEGTSVRNLIKCVCVCVCV